MATGDQEKKQNKIKEVKSLRSTGVVIYFINSKVWLKQNYNFV